MKPFLIFLVTLTLFVLSVVVFWKFYNKVYKPNTGPNLVVSKQDSENLPKYDVFDNTPTPKADATTVLVYLVDLENSRKAKTTIGCGDSLVAVTKPADIIDKTPEEKVTAALTALFAIKTSETTKGGYYNAIAQSDLKVDKVVINQGLVTVYLTGQITTGGVCDSPRFEEQIKATATQFPFTRHATIYMDGKVLNFSMK